MMMLSAEIGKDIDILKDLNKTNVGRMLADENVEFLEEDTASENNLNPGTDGALDETEMNDITEIPQTTLTDELDTKLTTLPDTDTGSVGGDSTVDDEIPGTGGSSGTSFMTWVMYIGGAILVMALIAGACYLI